MPRLMALVGHPEKDVRDAAADAMGKIGPITRVFIPTLIEHLANGDTGVRVAAARALGEMKAEAARAGGDLARCVSDPSPGGRLAGSRA
ncbi:MAG: HEAT repeat domain-containing protein, partial [Planctomycetes bacterium]|nr:HEAT repeat domain-containing protein [Planctomycetota bacterium]